MVNASWDIVIVGLIVSPLSPSSTQSTLPPFNLTPLQAYFWVETKGRTLEEIDALFDREKHSTVPDVEAIRTGKEQLDVKAEEKKIENEKFERKVD